MNTKRSKRAALALTLFCVPAAFRAAGTSAEPMTSLPPAYECEGNACGAVTVTWDSEKERFRAANSGARPARVEAFGWSGGCSILVGAGASAYLTVKRFDGPYRANFE